VKINKLRLINFRNYSKLDIDFNDHLNIIIGNNAQGKTNILEAIYFLSITKSFLSNNDGICINNGQLFFKIFGDIITNDGIKKLSILFNENGKKLTINDNEIKKHALYIGNLKVILFNPDNVRLIKDAPGNRRKFLNIEISQLDNKYINILNEYNIVLKQRNEYLKVIKSGKINEVYFDIINEKLVMLAVSIYEYRIKFTEMINKYITNIFKDISGYDDLVLKYIPSVDISDISNIGNNIRDKMASSYDREVFYGNSLVGPHRDDFSFKLGENDLVLYGSQGQLKMAILALKLAEVNVFKDTCNEYPVLLLDDLFSELDVNKRNKVINYLNRDIQTIVTTTDLENIEDNLVKNSYVYKIENGNVCETIMEGRDNI